MPPKECLTCKPGDDAHHESAVRDTGCEESYLLVDACMKLNNGRVSACTQEWAKFRQCHEQGKSAHKSGNKK